MSTRLARLSVVAAVVAVSSVVPGVARGQEPVAVAYTGWQPCVLVAATSGNDWWTGTLVGGPVAGPDSTADVAITCTVQVGSANSVHRAADAAAVTSPTMPWVAVIPPPRDGQSGVVDFVGPEGQPIYVCTHVRIDSVDWYWDAIAADWSTSNSTACEHSITQEVFPGPFGPVLDLTDELVEPVCGVTDDVFPPDGDVPPVLDCP